MSEYNDVIADGRDNPFDSERRGYDRRQVDEYIAWRNGQIRELESKLTAGLSEIERLRRELNEARDAAGRPPHEEISERVGQILKLAADEAKSEREKVAAEITQMRDIAQEETDKLRSEAKDEVERLRSEAQDRAERMLTAAQEQSERAVSSARAEADSLVSTAQQTADQTIADATQHADSTVSAAISQAKQQLDDATARATAIHDGAERRLNLLISRHTETVRRLTEIRDVVTSLVAGEAARGSLEDEVTRALAAQAGASNERERQSSGPHDAPHAGAHRAGMGHRTSAGPGAQAGQAGPAAHAESRRSASTPLDGPAEPLAARQSPRPGPVDREDPLSPDRTKAAGPSARHEAPSSADTAQLPADSGDEDEDDEPRRTSSDTLIH